MPMTTTRLAGSDKKVRAVPTWGTEATTRFWRSSGSENVHGSSAALASPRVRNRGGAGLVALDGDDAVGDELGGPRTGGRLEGDDVAHGEVGHGDILGEDHAAPFEGSRHG